MKVTNQFYRRSTRFLVMVFFVIAVFHIVAVLVDLSSLADFLKRITGWFDLDKEYVVPSLYTSLLLAICGLVTVNLARIQFPAKRRLVWWMLAVFFVYLAIDEALIVHEQVAEPLRNFWEISADSLFYHAWVVPALLVAALGTTLTVIAAKYHLISRSQIVIITLLLMLIAGNVVIETLGTKVYGSQLAYRLGAVMIEELFEIGMISLLLHRLLGFAHALHSSSDTPHNNRR